MTGLLISLKLVLCLDIDCNQASGMQMLLKCLLSRTQVARSLWSSWLKILRWISIGRILKNDDRSSLSVAGMESMISTLTGAWLVDMVGRRERQGCGRKKGGYQEKVQIKNKKKRKEDWREVASQLRHFAKDHRQLG